MGHRYESNFHDERQSRFEVSTDCIQKLTPAEESRGASVLHRASCLCGRETATSSCKSYLAADLGSHPRLFIRSNKRQSVITRLELRKRKLKEQNIDSSSALTFQD